MVLIGRCRNTQIHNFICSTLDVCVCVYYTACIKQQYMCVCVCVLCSIHQAAVHVCMYVCCAASIKQQYMQFLKQMRSQQYADDIRSQIALEEVTNH